MKATSSWVAVLFMLTAAMGARAHAQTADGPPVPAARVGALLCDASTDATFRAEIIARWRLGDRVGARRSIERVSSLRPECSVIGALRTGAAAQIDPGLVLELSEPGLARLVSVRGPSDATSALSHGLGVVGLVLGAAGVATSVLGAWSRSCDHAALASSCDPTPRTVLLSTGVFTGVAALAATIAAIILRVEVGRARHAWAIEAFAL